MSIIRQTLTPSADGSLQLDLSAHPELAGQDLEVIVRPARAAATPRDWRPGIDPVPPSGKVVGDPEKDAMIDAALDAWLTTGRFNDAFEARLAEFVGTTYGGIVLMPFAFAQMTGA